MTLSPLQQDYVTKTEFNEFRDDVTKQFSLVDENFSKVHEDIRNIQGNIKSMQDDFGNMREDFKNHTGILIETFRHELRASMEYIDSRLDKKLDKEEFYEYMQLHFPKQTKSHSMAKK